MDDTSKKAFEKTLATYIAGFILSIGLTFAAYYLAVDRASVGWSGTLAPWAVAGIIAALALVQFVVQLFFFMHLRFRTKPRWRLTVFLFMIMVVLILVGGSVWIMASLNSRMAMTPDQIDQYMQDQAGI